MKKDNEYGNSLADKAVDLVLGEKKDAKVYSHAVFCQCILPVRSLPKEEEFYQVQHGNTSLIIQSKSSCPSTFNVIKLVFDVNTRG